MFSMPSSIVCYLATFSKVAIFWVPLVFGVHFISVCTCQSTEKHAAPIDFIWSLQGVQHPCKSEPDLLL